MNLAQPRVTITIVLIFLAIGRPLRASDRDEREAATRFEQLIESLASKNSEPEISNSQRNDADHVIAFPSDYNRVLQVPVYLAVMALLAEDDAVIDALWGHEEDDRYSFSVNSGDDYNVSVSQACNWIAQQKLLCYESELHVITGSQFRLYPDKLQEASIDADWWNENKQRGLPALQIEAIDAAIEFMTEVDGGTARPWHPEAERLPLDEFDRRRAENLQTLKAIRAYIEGTGTAYRPKTLDDHYSCIFGLPWSGRRYNK